MTPTMLQILPNQHAVFCNRVIGKNVMPCEKHFIWVVGQDVIKMLVKHGFQWEAGGGEHIPTAQSKTFFLILLSRACIMAEYI